MNRPITVTAPSWLALGYAAFGLLLFLAVFTGGSPSAFLFFAFNIWFLVLAVVVLTITGTLALAALAALRGHSWGRFVLIGVFGFLTWIGMIAGRPALFLPMTLLSLAAASSLLTPSSKAWFTEGRA